MQAVDIRMCPKNAIIVSILMISTLNFSYGTISQIPSDLSIRKYVEPNAKRQRETHPKQKNEITGALTSKKVCMNVCNPPYYNQEFPPSNGGHYNPGGNQYNPGEGQQHPGVGQQYPGVGQQHPGVGQQYPGEGQNNLAGGLNNPIGWNQNYPPWGYGGLQSFDPGYGYQNFDENQFFPEGSFGDYIAGCYRNMFRRRYKLDPGHQKPTIFNYKMLSKPNYESLRKSRKYKNSFQDFVNCQLICYPVMQPSYTPTSSQPSTTSEDDETTEENTSTTKKQATTKKSRKTKRHKGNTAV